VKKSSVFLIFLSVILIFFIAFSYFRKKKQSVVVEETPTEQTPTDLPPAMPTKNGEYIKEIALWSLINTWREAHELDEFFIDEQLCQYTEERIGQVDDSLSHEGFFPLSEKIQQQTEFNKLAENLASGVIVGKEDEVLTAWLDSEEHLKNLEDEFVYSCIKCRGVYCVQLFARY